MSEEYPLVSVRITHHVPEPVVVNKEPVYPTEHVVGHIPAQHVPARDMSTNQTNVLGPEDPSEDENNVCISCQ